MRTVCILGYGEIGRALDAVLSQKHDITLERWDKNIDIFPEQKSLADIIPLCDVLFVCIPTWLVRSALQGIHELLSANTVVVSVSKGFEKESCVRVDTLFRTMIGNEHPLAFLGGPMIAEELLTGTRTRAIAASTDTHVNATLNELFASTSIALETSDDFEGVVTAASLKNIYALGLGISDALNLGANAHGVLLAQAAQEMVRVVVANGGRAESAFGLAGLADLVATSQSPNSTNYTTGVRFARGLPPLRGSEALNTLPCVMQSMETLIADLPFLHALYTIVVQGADPKSSMERLLS